ncbi:acyltransferase family protein [Sediminibacillus massiliensis]|uniref:acyltransferase family protein n=1 Tax=Sediminibacillus massiliensis TaxID=1926277 RepID=UPI0009883B02|nr:acyltransferase family protein [Sediminibacillus massiliensis]
MELSRNDTRILKGVGIIFMVMLHLFTRKEINGLYETFILIGDVPLVYYIGHFGDACRPIYLFASGYAFYIAINSENNIINRIKKNTKRIMKLLINYWIVLIMFIIISFFIGKEYMMPGSVKEFLLNFFVLSNSYNGAWWFLQIYIILVILSPILMKLVKNNNSILSLFFIGVIYSISYLQFYKDIFEIGDHGFLAAITRTAVLTGTSLFSFIVGALFAKKKIFTYLHKNFYEVKFRNFICYLGILILLVIHSIFESTSIAPLTGISFICFFIFIDKSNWVKKILNIFAEHSTNIWLTHMFFYLTLFPGLTFAPKYPILIFIWLLILCIVTSYLIKFIYNPILRFIDTDKKLISLKRQAVR